MHSLYIHGSNKLFDDFKDPNTNIGQLIFSWDYERKIEYGRLDYQDLHIIVPVAIEHGFDMFRVKYRFKPNPMVLQKHP